MAYMWHDVKDYYKVHKIKYDKIVDDKDFSKLSQAKRIERLNSEGMGASAVQGSYDFAAGQIRRPENITDAILALRSGKLDKADVAAISEQIQEELKKDLTKQERDRLLKQQEEVSRKRQEFIDAELGYHPESNPESV